MTISQQNEGSFDTVLKSLKWNGMYQVIQIALNIWGFVPIVFSIMSIIFLGYNVPSHCRDVNETSMFQDYGIDVDISAANITYGECGITISSNQSGKTELSCVNGYDYSQPRDRSLNSDWDLVCGKESLSDLLQTLYTVGTGIGALVFTILADKKGRKFANCIAGLCFLVVSCIVAYIPSYIPSAVMRVVLGAAQMGINLTGTILYVEIVPTEHRSTVAVIATLLWSLSVVLYAVVAYLMRDLSWRLHQLIIGLFLCHYLFMPWLLDESFRWLGAMKKHDVIEQNLRKAARMNDRDEVTIVALLREQHKPSGEENGQEDEDKVDLNKESTASDQSQIFRDKKILFISVIVWFMWITDTLTYYGLSLTSTEFHSNKYIGFGLSAIMEVFGALAYWFTIERFGRKRSAFMFHLLAGSSLFLSAIFQNFSGTVPSFSTVVTVLVLIGKFAISTSFCVIWFYTPEIFPTTIRNFAMGLASGFARIGGIFAPFSRTLHRHYPWALGTIFGSFCVIVSLLVRYLPETTHQELPQTIAEMKSMLNSASLNKDKKQQITMEFGMELDNKLLST